MSGSRRNDSKKSGKVGVQNLNGFGLESQNRFVGLTERFLDDATEEIVEMKKSTGGEGPSFMQRIPNKDKLENIAKPSLRKQKDQHGMVNFKVVEPMVTISHGNFPKFTFQAGTFSKKGSQACKTRPKINMGPNVQQTSIKINEGGLSAKLFDNSSGGLNLVQHFTNPSPSSLPQQHPPSSKEGGKKQVGLTSETDGDNLVMKSDLVNGGDLSPPVDQQMF